MADEGDSRSPAAPASQARIVRCPTCSKPVKWTAANRFRPFCSERCRLIDFGAWANEDRVIAGDPVYDDIESDRLDELRDSPAKRDDRG